MISRFLWNMRNPHEFLPVSTDAYIIIYLRLGADWKRRRICKIFIFSLLLKDFRCVSHSFKLFHMRICGLHLIVFYVQIIKFYFIRRVWKYFILITYVLWQCSCLEVNLQKKLRTHFLANETFNSWNSMGKGNTNIDIFGCDIFKKVSK